jgi:hypothetical protein
MASKMFSRISFLAVICGMSFSCSDNLDQDTPSITLDNLDLSGLSIELNPVVIDLNEYALDQLIKDLSTELYEIDLNQHSKSMNLPINQEATIGFSILLDMGKNQATITPLDGPIEQSLVSTTNSKRDDSTMSEEQPSEDWTSVGSCENAAFVTEKMLAAVQNFEKVDRSYLVRVIRGLTSVQVSRSLI